METSLADIAKQLKALRKSEIRTWLRKGELIHQARELCKGDRDFAAWLRTAGEPRTTAYKALRAFENFGKCAAPVQMAFTKEAMDILAGYPDAIEDAIKLAANGPVNAKIAKSLVSSPTVEMASPIDGRTRVFTGEGWKVSLTLDQPGTDSDFMAALSQAIKKIQNAMTPATSAAVSPLDRLRSRIAG